MKKLKTILPTSIGAIAIAVVGYWLLIQQPAQQAELASAERALLSSGMRLYNEKNFEKSIMVFEQIEGDSEHAAKARYYQGNALIMLQDYQAGAEQLEESLALRGDDADTRFALGVVYFKLGNLSLAKGYFASVLEIEPANDQERERMEEAAGLMDIMARLERQQPGADPGVIVDEEPGTGD